MNESDLFSGASLEASLLNVSRARVLALCSAGTIGIATLFMRSTPVVALIAAVVFTISAFTFNRVSIADYAVRSAKYFSRSRWTSVAAYEESSLVQLRARGRRSFSTHRLEYRGRPDLADAEQPVLDEIASAMDRAANETSPQHLSWHLDFIGPNSQFVLCTPGTTTPTGLWKPLGLDALTARVGLAPRRVNWFFERWTHVRSADELFCVFVVRSSSGSGAGYAVHSLATWGSEREISVQVRIEPTHKSRAIIGRHAHKWRANLAIASLAGYRQRATFDATSALLERRERDVAAGRALAEVVVFIVLRAPSRAELDRRIERLRHDARRSGVVIERGNGRHATWFCAQLPCSPAWRTL